MERDKETPKRFSQLRNKYCFREERRKKLSTHTEASPWDFALNKKDNSLLNSHSYRVLEAIVESSRVSRVDILDAIE